MEEKFLILSRAMLCMQEALLGSVVPSLRAVTVDVDIETKTLFFSLFFDGKISDELFDLASAACAKASAKFPGYFLNNTIVRLDFPQKMPFRGRYAYLRKECPT